MSFLGLDIGSSQVKAVVYDRSGKELASAYSKYSYTTPRPGWMELDSTTVLAGALSVISQAAQAVEASDPVETLCASSQGEAFTPVDANGRILGPAMISGDTRAASEAADFARSFGADKLYKITGHTISPMFSLSKLLWIKKHQPELWQSARWFLCFEDLVCRELTGIPTMGFPLAGRTMLFDVTAEKWSQTLLDAIGLSGDKLALPLPSGSIAGAILEPEKLHLAANAVWVTGGHDQVMGALGCGAWEDGTAMFAAGSVESMVPVMKKMCFAENLQAGNLCTYHFALPGKYATVAYSLNGSNMQEYFVRKFCPGCDYDEVLDAMPSEVGDLLVIPYLGPSGTPFFDTVTPACVYGWRFNTTPAELLKAFWEGIAFEMKLNMQFLKLNDLNISKLVASGGGFRHPATVQLHADILNVPISISSVRETGCRGAAMLGQSALGDKDCFTPPEIVSVTCPDPEKVQQYQQKFLQWEKFSQTIRNFSNGNSQF